MSDRRTRADEVPATTYVPDELVVKVTALALAMKSLVEAEANCDEGKD